jgi:hypothetical protein
VVVVGQTEATEGGVGAAVVVRRGDVVTGHLHLSQAVVWNCACGIDGGGHREFEPTNRT